MLEVWHCQKTRKPKLRAWSAFAVSGAFKGSCGQGWWEGFEQESGLTLAGSRHPPVRNPIQRLPSERYPARTPHLHVGSLYRSQPRLKAKFTRNKTAVCSSFVQDICALPGLYSGTPQRGGSAVAIGDWNTP